MPAIAKCEGWGPIGRETAQVIGLGAEHGNEVVQEAIKVTLQEKDLVKEGQLFFQEVENEIKKTAVKKIVVDTNNYNPFTINKPNIGKWNYHIMKPPKHNFNGIDPHTAWELTEKAIIAAIKNNELKNGYEYIINYATKFGNLVVKGKVINNVAEIGTAFIKKAT